MYCFFERVPAMFQNKMRIPIKVSENGVTEWYMLELQGKIFSSTGSFAGQSFGPLTFKGDQATLTIGNHQMRGKVHRLKNPLVVMKRGTEDGVEIGAVIRKKVIFSDRPIILFPENQGFGSII